jgi:hypothetical protein
MKKLWKLVIIITALLTIGSCIESTTRVHVQKDGSGEVEDTLLMRTDVIQTLMSMSQEMGEESGNFELITREELEQRAREMGAGVTLETVEKIVTETHTGYRALYTFQDINTLQVNENPDENMPESGGPGEEAPNREIITFQFEKAKGKDPASLIINLPREEEGTEGEQPEEKPEEQSEDMIDMFREIFKDLKIDVALEVDGRITETNATHLQGSKVILMELDFGKIIQNEEVFRELALSNTKSLEETKELLKDVPGIKVEMQDRIEVQFE